MNAARDPYKNLNILDYGNNTAYEFLNEKSDKLVIFIDGTRWYSVLGWKEGDKWASLTSSKFFLDVFKGNTNFMIPERLNMQIGKFYLYNPDMRRNYTLENLVQSYSSTINTYLNERDFSSVIIMGNSEGASLLPLVYGEIIKKEKITGMIAISYGGLSVYEQVKILANSELSIPDYYREACQNIDQLRTEVETYPDSLGEIMGYTYGWWNSFLDYRPCDYYANINIPILFIHGKQDITVPVESTQYVQEKKKKKPFDYLYIDNTDHRFISKKSREELVKNIKKWVTSA
jgi:pimeloyl-ACP methyl ester carboxylesterase